MVEEEGRTNRSAIKYFRRDEPYTPNYQPKSLNPPCPSSLNPSCPSKNSQGCVTGLACNIENCFLLKKK